MSVQLVPINYNKLERQIVAPPLFDPGPVADGQSQEALVPPESIPIEPIVYSQPVEDLRTIPIEDIFTQAGLTHINGKPIKFGNSAVRTPDSPYYKKTSWHSQTDETGTAAARDISIVGGNDADYAALQQAMLSSPLIQEYFKQKSWGVINEITNQILGITGGSGKHFHLGPDKWAVRTWNAWNTDPNTPVTLYISAKNGTKLIPKGQHSLKLIPVADPLNEALDKVEQRAIRRATTPQVVPVPTISVPTIRPGDYANMSGPDNYTFNSDVTAQQESRRIAAQNAMVEAQYEANTVPVQVSTAGGGTTTVRVPKDWGYTEGQLVSDPRATAIAQGEQPERYADPVNNALNWGIFTALTGGAAASNGAFSNTSNMLGNFAQSLRNPATLTHQIIKPVLFSEITGRTLDLGYGLGNQLANGEYYTLTDHLTDMWRNLGLSDTWANLAGGLSNPGYWAGFKTRSLVGLEDAGREASTHQAIMKYVPTINPIQRNVNHSSAPTIITHLKGDQAVQMFKDVGDDVIIPEGSPLYERLLAYVPEVKLRYGLNDQLTDDYIARVLYKHIINNLSETAAVNTRGEPLILFRGDTKPYTQLLPRMSPQELLTNSKSASMDNSLGTLFLGDFRIPDAHSGVGRYLVGWKLSSNDGWERVGAWDGIAQDMPEAPTPDSYLLFNGTVNNRWPAAFIKAPARFSPTGTNDLNAFVVKTSDVFDGTNAVTVEDVEDFLPTLPQWRGPKVEVADRADQAVHYQNILDEMEKNNQGLLWSSRWNPNIMKGNVRGEHYMYNYYAVPNFNIQSVKHILPYDLRVPINWNDPNIYRKDGGTIKQFK